MNILSLFDGISCTQVALSRLGIKYNYYASEIDKYAIKITQKNYPNTIQLGDIRNISSKQLPQIDLVVGGSPCQGFSIAGKQLNFKDERSKLFYEYLRLVRECNPTYFLLENVVMKKEYRDVISKELGVEPICINSALVSAQNRNRLYWTNIKNIEQPVDKNIKLKDILVEGYVNRDKSYCIDANYFKGTNLATYIYKGKRQLVFKDYKSYLDQIGSLGNGQDFRVYGVNKKSVTLAASGQKGYYLVDKIIRKLTPVECERLQTLEDNYTKGISNTQRYKCLGNAFTVDVVKHILSYII